MNPKNWWDKVEHCEEFLERHGLAQPMCGSDFGPGWTKILDELVVDLKALGWDGQVDQIKEKFGGLRFYISTGTQEIYDRIDKAERESLRTCERCGAPGVVRSGSWLKCLCDEHADGRQPAPRYDTKRMNMTLEDGSVMVVDFHMPPKGGEEK